MSDLAPVAAYTCTNPDCSEHGIAKVAFADWGDDEVLCGECQQPCTKQGPTER